MDNFKSYLICFFICIFSLNVHTAELPEGFVYVKDIIPSAEIDIRYCTNDNFVGRPIDGYIEQKAILTKEAAQALKKVAQELKEYGFRIKLFDTYRPQRAVDHFVKWAKNLDDTTMKNKYYPEVDKDNLFKEEYIAEQSSHSRGSTVDLTIIYQKSDTVQELDMGSNFDYFGKKSWTNSRKVTSEQRAHRLFLKLIMTKYGFDHYSREWWHFTYEEEPYPDTYFNFTVQ